MKSENGEIKPAELTDEIVDQIIFGMENQETSFLFDLAKGELIQKNEGNAEELEADQERYISLPDWKPVDGFRLMERFVSYIKNPIYREELRDALNGGRGVFRRFKDVIKRYEPLEKQWFVFKEKEMRQIVRNWYAAVNEAADLERLGDEPEETEDLVLSDFLLRQGVGRWKDVISDRAGQALLESVDDAGRSLREYLLGTEVVSSPLQEGCEIVYAETPTGDFAGCILGLYREFPYSTVLELRFVYVEPEFRGMGLSRLFIDTITDLAASKGASQIVMELLGKSVFLQPELEERGFKEFSRRYTLPLEFKGEEQG